MSAIKLLSKSLSQKIAAGEVVERPSSVVKELLENSIDANSSFITVEIEEGGKKLIRISDNGNGIAPDEVELAFVRHATSKIETEDDLYNISCMGFRGEALYSISAVSRTTMLTKTMDSEAGKKVVVEGGEIAEISDAGCPDGTTIIVRDLFYNTPARLKFMKSNAAETSQIASIVQKIILSQPEISIKLISNGQLVYQSSGDGSIKNAVYSIYGANIASSVKEFEYSIDDLKVYGVLGGRDTFRSSRINQTLFVNHRYVRDSALNQAIESAYGSVLMKSKFPFYVIFIEVNTQYVDVNVHPQKLFVKFSNQKEIKSSVYEAVKTFTGNLGTIPEMLISEDTPKVTIDSIRAALSFEKVSVEKSSKKTQSYSTLKKDESEKDKNKGIAKEEFAPRHYDYKKEIETKRLIKEPTILRQTSSPSITNINLEETQKTYLDEESSAKTIGVAFNTYIIVEYNEDIYMIDQHAAHERLIYERLYEQFVNENVASQQLLIPQENEITYQEKIMLEEYIHYFKKVGFELEIKDNLRVIIKAVPHLLGQPRFSSFFMELFDLLSQDVSKDELSIVKKIISMSCKKAVKGGDSLSSEEISLLIRNIKEEDIPLTCPHGRPFVMKISKKQIDKKAGRIN